MPGRIEPASAEDSIATIAAVALLAYASADLGHHALGHGMACLAAGGQIASLSSIFVDCSRAGTAIDLAGPLANLLIGSIAGLSARVPTRESPAILLFLALVFAFNLLWFAGQLMYSAAGATDDWAWAMQEFHASPLMRAGMIVGGAIAYWVTLLSVAEQLARFGRTRLKRIVVTAWLAAGGLACASAALEQHPLAAVLRHAAPQSLVNSIGLLFIPALTARRWSGSTYKAIPFSIAWACSAALVSAVSVGFFGPGFSMAF